MTVESQAHPNTSWPAPGSHSDAATAHRVELDSSTEKDFRLFEDKVVRERTVISNLRHFTEYRIDIHACNHAAQTVGCSAATFVFARTMPEGEPKWPCPFLARSCQLLTGSCQVVLI